MVRKPGAKLVVLVLSALMVAVVPEAIRFSHRDQGHRLETEGGPDDGAPEAEAEADPADDAEPELAVAEVDEVAEPLVHQVTVDQTTVPESEGTDPTDEAAGSTSTSTSTPGEPGQAEAGGENGEGTATGPGTTAAPGGAATTGGQGSGTTTTTTATTARPAAPAQGAPVVVGSSAPGTGLRTLYVDGSRGKYSNPGTEDRPFGRPIDALTKAEPGTTIYIRGGTYDTNTHGAFNITRSGTAQNWIKIAPYPGERVELVTGGDHGSGFEFLGASYVELSGFVIRARNDSIHGSGVFMKDGAHDIRVIGNQISNFGGAGISAVGGSRYTIEGNDVRENAHRSHYQGSAISLYKMSGPTASGGNFSNVIRGNYVVHNYNAVPHRDDGRITDGNCIILDRNDESGYTGRTLIENNVCAENGGRGIHGYNSSNFVVRNNTLYHNMVVTQIASGRGELTAGHGDNIIFANNLVINGPGVAAFINTSNTNIQYINNLVASGPPPGTGNRALPSTNIFSSTTRGGPVGQFRPLSSAGLAGTAAGGQQSSRDLSGRSRPNPGAVGAFEP